MVPPAVRLTLTSRPCPLAIEWAEELREDAVLCVQRLAGLGYASFAIQAEDRYTHVPAETDYVSAEAVVATMRAQWAPERKELWGMVWAR